MKRRSIPSAALTSLTLLTGAALAWSQVIPDPVAYWPMRDGLPGDTVAGADDLVDDPSHPATDATRSGNTNATWDVDPIRGIVYNSSEGNRLNAGKQGIDLNNGFAWSFWAKVASSNNTDPGADVIMGTRQGGSSASSTTAWHKIDRGGVSAWNGSMSIPNLADDTWHHVAYVGDTDGRKFYVDGVEVGSNPSIVVNTIDRALEIGGSSQFSEDVTGLYSDVAVWDTTLSPTQVVDIFNGAAIFADTTAPLLVATSPEDNDTNAPSNLIRAILDEPVEVGSGDVRIVNESDTVTTTLAIDDTTQVLVSGASITLTPAVALIAGKDYHIEMDSGVVTSVSSGLDFPGIIDTTTWNFTVDSTAPNLAFIEDSVGGGPVGEDLVVITFTVTFDEPMDGSSIDASDFDNAGGATGSIGTVTEVSSTVFTVEYLPTSTGTVRLRIPTGSVVTDLSGNALVVPVLDNDTITIDPGPSADNGLRYWDGGTTDDTTLGNGISDGGSGIWIDFAITNWDRGAGFNYVLWDNGNIDDTAVFGGANGTATLGSDISLGGIIMGKITNTMQIQDGSGFDLNFAPGSSILVNDPTSNRTLDIRAGVTGRPTATVNAGDRLFVRHEGGSTGAFGDLTFQPRVDGASDNQAEFQSSTGSIGNVTIITSNNGQRAQLRVTGNSNTWTIGDLRGDWNSRLRLILRDGSRAILTGDVYGVEIRMENSNNSVLGFQQAGDLLTESPNPRPGSNSNSISALRGTFENSSGGLITFATNPDSTFGNHFTLSGRSMDFGTGTVNLNNSTRNITVDDTTSILTFGGRVRSSTEANGGITKLGPGTLELMGDNTYAGATTVTEGVLALTGGSQSSAITVESGALLGLTIDSSTVSIAALTLDAGHAVRIFGTPTEASYTLMTTSAVTGTPVLESPIAGYELVVEGGTALVLNQTGAVSAYDSWATANGLTGGAGSATDPATGADGDGGGKTNLYEFGFNGGPLAASNEGLLYSLIGDADGDTDDDLIFTIAVRSGTVFTGGTPATSAAVDGIVYTVRGDVDLVSFGDTQVNVAGTAVVPAGAPDLTGTDYEYVSLWLEGSVGETLTEGFMQAEVAED